MPAPPRERPGTVGCGGSIFVKEVGAVLDIDRRPGTAPRFSRSPDKASHRGPLRTASGISAPFGLSKLRGLVQVQQDARSPVVESCGAIPDNSL
jgi:hypothetical protein